MEPLNKEKRIKREIANSNERRRMQSINAGFQKLKRLLPVNAGEKISKANILQHAADFITNIERDRIMLAEQNTLLRRILLDLKAGKIDLESALAPVEALNANSMLSVPLKLTLADLDSQNTTPASTPTPTPSTPTGLEAATLMGSADMTPLAALRHAKPHTTAAAAAATATTTTTPLSITTAATTPSMLTTATTIPTNTHTTNASTKTASSAASISSGAAGGDVINDAAMATTTARPAHTVDSNARLLQSTRAASKGTRTARNPYKTTARKAKNKLNHSEPPVRGGLGAAAAKAAIALPLEVPYTTEVVMKSASAHHHPQTAAGAAPHHHHQRPSDEFEAELMAAGKMLKTTNMHPGIPASALDDPDGPESKGQTLDTICKAIMKIEGDRVFKTEKLDQ